MRFRGRVLRCGEPDAESLKRVDVYLRFADTPAPTGHPELAKGAGLGREIPTEWFLQDIRD